ncbi:MAG: biopolymer transporter ExbD, partial [Alphaproteobacteria bacterium]|nr:biopolymer transporter ExbD [Alphaproteobacteria bacterium]
VALDGMVMTQSEMITVLTQRLKDQPDTMVRLKADGRIDATKVVGVMEKLREVGVSRLKLLTVPAPEVETPQ